MTAFDADEIKSRIPSQAIGLEPTAKVAHVQAEALKPSLPVLLLRVVSWKDPFLKNVVQNIVELSCNNPDTFHHASRGMGSTSIIK